MVHIGPSKPHPIRSRFQHPPLYASSLKCREVHHRFSNWRSCAINGGPSPIWRSTLIWCRRQLPPRVVLSPLSSVTPSPTVGLPGLAAVPLQPVLRFPSGPIYALLRAGSSLGPKRGGSSQDAPHPIHFSCGAAPQIHSPIPATHATRRPPTQTPPPAVPPDLLSLVRIMKVLVITNEIFGYDNSTNVFTYELEVKLHYRL